MTDEDLAPFDGDGAGVRQMDQAAINELIEIVSQRNTAEFLDRLDGLPTAMNPMIDQDPDEGTCSG